MNTNYYQWFGFLKGKKSLPANAVNQAYSNLAREIHFPAEFSSNPSQTYQSMLINVFMTIRKS